MLARVSRKYWQVDGRQPTTWIVLSHSHMGKLIATLQFLWLTSLREQQVGGLVEELNIKVVFWSPGGR